MWCNSDGTTSTVTDKRINISCFKMVGVPYMIIVISLLLLVHADDLVQDEENLPCALVSATLVDCANRDLHAIPDALPKWTRTLNLNNNWIRNLNKDKWKDLTSLETLKLNKNKITTIQKDTFENLKSLKSLELNRNLVDNIAALSFQNLERVTILKLRRNKIRHLHDGTFFGLKKIRQLNLDYNLVQVIRKSWLYNLENLKVLSLSNNMVTTVDYNAWEFCKGLVELDLSSNRLRVIKRDTFRDLAELETLNLRRNNITIIEEDAFTHTPKLKVLDLSYNRVSWTIEDANGVYRGLTSLMYFYIASNEIKSVNKNAFNGLSKLTHLDLNNNNITSIQKNAFSEMPLLDELALNTTSLLCDCNLQWFYDYLNLNKLNVTTICTYPEWLRGYSLQNVPPNNFSCDELPKPRIIEEPGVEIMALKEEDISLTCRAVSSSPSKMIFKWKKDNVELRHADVTIKATSFDGKNTESVSFLNITKVQHSDAGKYQCLVSNDFGTTYAQKSIISVLIYPTFTKTPSNITVLSGTMASLVCSASGEPPPEIAWQKDGGTVFPAARERRMQLTPANDVIFIISAKLSDMGVYSCTAHNAAGTIVANATLTVEEKPSFVKPMENKEVVTGESIVVQCMASGAPKPTIQWLKDEVPITPSERHFFTAEEQLMIIIDSVLSDTGNYTCKLSNSLGTEMGNSTIIVKEVVMGYGDMFGIIITTVLACALFTSLVWSVIIYQTRRRFTNFVNTNLDFQAALNLNDNIDIHYSDNASEHSSCKDSGTGDSAKRSNDDLLPPDEITLIINNATIPEEKSTTMRAASLVYLASEGAYISAPLLINPNDPYIRSTNHDRQADAPPEEDSADTNDKKQTDFEVET